MGTSAFSKVQYMAWVDFLSFFIWIGPTLLIFLAAGGVHPHYAPHVVHLGNNKHVAVPIKLYGEDRGMTPAEYRIMQQVRIGCGRLYTRNFMEIWQDGSLAKTAFKFLITAISLPMISAVLFLLAVPGNSISSKLMPLLHLVLQYLALSTCLIGNYILTDPSLCFLNTVWDSLPLQWVIPFLSLLICGTYKVYEMRLIIEFCKIHLEQWQREQHQGKEFKRTPSDELLELVERLQRLADDEKLEEEQEQEKEQEKEQEQQEQED